MLLQKKNYFILFHIDVSSKIYLSVRPAVLEVFQIIPCAVYYYATAFYLSSSSIRVFFCFFFLFFLLFYFSLQPKREKRQLLPKIADIPCPLRGSQQPAARPLPNVQRATCVKAWNQHKLNKRRRENDRQKI